MKGIEILEMRYVRPRFDKKKVIGVEVAKSFRDIRLPGEAPIVVTSVEKVPEGYLEVSNTWIDRKTGRWFVEFWFGPATPRAIEYARRVRGLQSQ
jgi:hypothetical protein